MSRFFSEKYRALTPYTPGEQPQDQAYVKLNTNESPFPPSPKAILLAAEAAAHLELYSDPTCHDLTERLAGHLGVSPEEVLLTNGSDEILNFAFMAFCDAAHPAVFPDITYGFYPVFARLNGVPYEELPLREDFSVDVDAYCGIGKTMDNVVVVDEAYVDFGAESCVPLIHTYDNLLVTQTFSKSRSMAGARLGFGVGSKALIRDLNTIKYSTNPYNINRMTMAAGYGVLEDEAYTRMNCAQIMETRAYTADALRKRGFSVLNSSANFLFAKSDRIDGAQLYLELKNRGVLVRHFTLERLKAYNRITIGSREQMETLLSTIDTILEEHA